MKWKSGGRIVRWTLSLACKTLGLALVLTGTASTLLARVPDVPEIDPGSATSAMALLSGGVMLVVDRIRYARSEK